MIPRLFPPIAPRKDDDPPNVIGCLTRDGNLIAVVTDAVDLEVRAIRPAPMPVDALACVAVGPRQITGWTVVAALDWPKANWLITNADTPIGYEIPSLAASHDLTLTAITPQPNPAIGGWIVSELPCLRFDTFAFNIGAGCVPVAELSSDLRDGGQVEQRWVA